jgi:hypothetical protein
MATAHQLSLPDAVIHQRNRPADHRTDHNGYFKALTS